MKRLIHIFIHERYGRMLDYLILIAIVAAMAAFIFPNVRKQTDCIHTETTKHFNQSIAGTSNAINVCDPDTTMDWISSDETPGGNPPPSGGTGDVTPPPPPPPPPVEEPVYPPSSADPTVTPATERDANNCRVIRTIGQFQAMGADKMSCYVLGNNIDATGTAQWNNGKGFETIRFAGDFGKLEKYFDGKGYTIKGLTMNQPDSYSLSVFSFINAPIRNITFESPKATGASGVFFLVNEMTGKTMKNVSVLNAEIKARDDGSATGIFGDAIGVSIKNVTFTGTVQGSGISSIGDYLVNSDVSGLYSKAELTSKSLHGEISGLFIRIRGDAGKTNVIEEIACECIFNGAAHTWQRLYGIGVLNHSSTVTVRNAYVVGKMNEEVYESHGLSFFQPLTKASNVYMAIENTPANQPKFYPIGTNDKNATLDTASMFYDSTLTPQRGGVGIPKTTSQLKTQSTYAGWDFTNVWAIDPSVNNGYPYLRNAPPK